MSLKHRVHNVVLCLVLRMPMRPDEIGEFPARMHKSKNLRELSARWACKRIAIVPWHPFSGISLQFRGVAL